MVSHNQYENKYKWKLKGHGKGDNLFVLNEYNSIPLQFSKAQTKSHKIETLHFLKAGETCKQKTLGDHWDKVLKGTETCLEPFFCWEKLATPSGPYLLHTWVMVACFVSFTNMPIFWCTGPWASREKLYPTCLQYQLGTQDKGRYPSPQERPWQKRRLYFFDYWNTHLYSFVAHTYIDIYFWGDLTNKYDHSVSIHQPDSFHAA